MVSKLAAGTMPPAASPQLTHIELDTLLSWASCGEVHAPPPTGLQANRAVWEAGPTPPANTTAIDVTAANEFIDVTVRDDYRNFNFTNLVASTKYIQRIEPVIDESRVLHHMTFTYGGGFPYVYAWAPGTGAIEFPNGGIALAPGDSFRLQIHYNNTAGIVDAYDSSGVRLWVGDQVGTAYGMMSPVSWNISVPPQSEGFATQECTVTMDFDILAGFPHMHETGDSFTHEVVRADGSVENLIDLTGWSFDSQYFYAMPVHINSGDVLRMTCRYYNPGDTTVKAGLATSDEMCFDFMVVTPAEAAGQCAR